MERQISCEFNINTACVEVKCTNGRMIYIDCTRVENEAARNMYEAGKPENTIRASSIQLCLSARK